MLKKILLITLLLNFLSHCDYKPIYSKQNNINYKISINRFTGDKDINNAVAANLQHKSKNQFKIIIG